MLLPIVHAKREEQCKKETYCSLSYWVFFPKKTVCFQKPLYVSMQLPRPFAASGLRTTTNIYL